MTEFIRVAVASRTFTLAAILGLAIVFRNGTALGLVLVVAGVAAVASYASSVPGAPSHWVMAVEGTVVSLLVVTALPDAVILLPYLVVLPLLTGLARGVPGASLVIVCQLTATFGAVMSRGGVAHLAERAELLAPWSLTIAGAGLLGAWTRKAGRSPAGSRAEEHYESTRRLLGQLRNLARRLPAGLDPVTISTQILASAQDALPNCQAAVFTKTEGGVFAPIAYHGVGARDALDPHDELLAKAWSTGSPAWTPAGGGPSDGTVVAIPLRLGSETVAVLAGQAPASVDTGALAVLTRDLQEMSPRLATGLAFDEVRMLVTADERKRLAREIHDGVAQEIASLGYAVDELAALSGDREMRSGLRTLRGELSRVVTELRLSIFDLRSDVGDCGGLGSALSDYVRKVGARSNMKVHLSLDEAPTRLSPGVETEMFRIAQEAITNARKHSEASNLWVDCRVHPPVAVVQVRDDGRGLGTGRSDSYGLRIMRERADRIGATLAVEELRSATGTTGTSVTVALAADTETIDERMSAAS